MIWTFYSAERGVGRSMAMANVAELCRRAGDRVIVADWDLESPGLERLFPAAERSIEERPGVIDLLTDYKAEISRPIVSDTDDVSLPTVQLDRYLTPVTGHGASPFADVRLMPAGRRDSTHLHEYARRVTAFDWSEFLTEWEGDLFLKELRGGLLNAADLVLIDSSAGLSSSSGVCTTLLADVVIMFCPPSTKSLERTVQTARELLSPIVFERRGGRPLDLLVVPARIDYGEAELLNDFKHRFLESLNGFVPTQIGDPAAFWNLRIPNIQYFAYRESLVIERPDEAISEPLVEAYQRLTATLKRLRRDASVPADQEAPKFDHSRSTSLARFRALRARKTDTPTVFISYAREDEIVVRTLYNRLIEAGFKAWLDTEHLLGGQPWETVIEERIESSDLVLVCLSHVAVAKKGFIQRELKKTLEVVDLQPEHAVFLIPVRLDACEIPRSLRKFNCIDLFEQNGAAKLDASIRYAWRQSRAAKT